MVKPVRDQLQDIAYDYEVMRVENMMLKQAMRSLVRGYDAAIKQGDGEGTFLITQEQARAILAVRDIL